MNVIIKNLKEDPMYIDTVINWLYSEWGNNNHKYWQSWIERSLFSDKIPQTYLLFVDGEIAGTYSLWRCDLQSRQDLFPWFGGLYIDPCFRGKKFNDIKLGVLLQNHAIQQLKKLGFKKAYLYTEKDPKYYISNGWQKFGVAPDEKDNIVTLCAYNIN